MRALLLLGAVSLLGGCGDDGGDGGGRADTGPGGSGLCAPEGGDADLSGQWAVQVNFDAQLNQRADALIALCPNPQPATAGLLFKFSNTVAGGAVTSDVTVCGVTLPTVTGSAGECNPDPTMNLEVSLELGMALRTALPTIALPELSSSLSGTTFDASPLPVVLGANLATPATDPLPTWNAMTAGCDSATTEDPMTCVDMFSLVEDTEMDGRPGVTLVAMSGDEAMTLRGSAFVVFRAVPQLSGTVRSSRCVEGSAAATLEYSIVGSDVILAAPPRLATASVISNIPPIEILPSSRFKMLRADGEGDHNFDTNGDGDVSCAEILGHENAFRR